MKKKTKAAAKIDVGIVLGSASDYPIVEEGEKILNQLGIRFKTTVASAHRTPDLVRRFVSQCEAKGAKVFIAAAGMAAALPGVVAAETLKPVIGVPISSPLSGLDSLLSIVQMPGGIPVATVAIGKAGARNAAILSGEILAVGSTEMTKRLKKLRQEQREKVIRDGKKLKTNT